MTALYHAYTQTVADGTATSVVRPSDWNSAHVQGQTISGNTAGFSSFTGTNIVLQGGNNVTLSAATAPGAATIIISGANTVAQTVQTQASGAIAGTGFTSTTTAGTNITAAVGTNGVSMAVPAYITTYVNDLTSGRAGTGFTSTTTAGTAITAALGTNGLSMAVPAFLTTSSQSVQTQASGNIAGTGYTSTTQAGSTVGVTHNTAGLSVAWPPYITTATQSTQTQASGAIAGTGFTSTTTAGTAVTAALGTNGLSMAVPAYITTYVNDLTSGRAGTGYTSTTQAGSTVGVTLNTSGLSMAWPPFITTATQSTQTQASGAIAGTGFTSTTTAGTAVTAALGTNGLSMAVPAYITTYVAQTTQTQATGAIAGTGFTSTTTAGTAITAALGNNGLSMAVPAYVTTYDATSGRAGTGTTLAITNAAATLNANTNGVALSINVSHDDFNAWNLLGNTAGTTSSSISTQGPFYLSGGNNVTLSGNSNTIVFEAGGGTTNQTGPNIAVAGSTITSGTVLFSNANGVTFGMNGSTVTASIVANNTYDGWAPYADLEMVAGQQGQGTLYIEPEHSPYYFQDRVGIPIAYTNASNSNGTLTLSYWVAFYTQNASTLSLASSTSTSLAFTFQGTTQTHWSLYSGMRLLTIPWTLTVAEQELYIAQLSRTSTGGNNASISQMLITNIASNFVGFFGQSHNTTQQWTQGQGIYTATTSAMPNSIAFSQLQGSGSLNFRAPAVMFINSTV